MDETNATPAERLAALHVTDKAKWFQTMRRALDAAGERVTPAAAKLGIAPRTLWRWCRDEPGLRPLAARAELDRLRGSIRDAKGQLLREMQRAVHTLNESLEYGEKALAAAAEAEATARDAAATTTG